MAGTPSSRPRRRLAVVALVACAALGVAACDPDPDAPPRVADVDLSPRLVVVADDRGLRAEVGPAGEGDERVSADPAEVPDGSVIEVRAEGTDPRRVVAERRAPTGEGAGGEGPATALLDTGPLPPGAVVTVALTEPGEVTFSVLDDGDRSGAGLVVTVTAGTGG